jgi:uncharacterized membrane protein
VTSIFTTSPAAAGYLAELRDQLGDFPEQERDEIVADVESSLLELPDQSDADLRSRFGTPSAFAEELRTAAGVHRAAEEPHPRPSVPLLERARQLAQSRNVAALRGSLSRLAPIGWVARAYLLVAAAALVLGTGWSAWHRELPRFANGGTSLAILAAAIIASVALGLHPGRLRMLLLAANVATLLAVVPVIVHLTQRARTPAVVVQLPAPTALQPGLTSDGRTVTNLYAYTRTGAMLHDILLYDQTGAPLQISSAVADASRRILRTASGKPLFNSFPIRYYHPGTAHVDQPNAGPTVRIPSILTPPLQPNITTRHR